METHKTEDNITFYKSGDIGQILLVEENIVHDQQESVHKPNPNPKYDDNYKIIDGLTPPTQNNRKRKFRERKKFDVCQCYFDNLNIINLG